MDEVTDQRPETYKHIQKVQHYLNRVAMYLIRSGEMHDQSKLEPPEQELFDKWTPKLAGMTYGSDEYKAALAALKPALDHHYAVNRHHPEHFDTYECQICGIFYSRADAPPVGYPDSDYRWCFTCHSGKYPGFFETALVKHHGIKQMNLLDIIEMLCDWKAASERHSDGDIVESIEKNQERFGYSDELKVMFLNTAKALGWAEKWEVVTTMQEIIAESEADDEGGQHERQT